MNRYEILLGKELWDTVTLFPEYHNHDPERFRQQYLGKFVIPTCSVTDGKGNHCPDEPKHFFEYHDKEVGLCERCYENYKSGCFDRRWQKENYGRILNWIK